MISRARPIIASIDTTLKKLKRYSCIGVKTSFEDEGASIRDVIRLRTLTSTHGLKLAVKIGGCEAKTDIQQVVDVCADSIVGPMIETPYAMYKYSQSVRDVPMSKGVNIETHTALENINTILTVQGIDYVVIGRVDLIGSMGISRNDMETEKINEMIETACKTIKDHGKRVYMGGAISQNTLRLVEKLYAKGLLDYVETRYIIFQVTPELLMYWNDAMKLSHQFELDLIEEALSRSEMYTRQLSERRKLVQTRVLRTFTIQNQVISYTHHTEDSFTIKASPSPYTVQFTQSGPVYEQGDFFIIDDKISFSCVQSFRITALEENKTIDTVMTIIRHIETLDYSPTRIVVIGGGILQDIGAFVSTIYKRGIHWVYWPTTLLSMADSCIGGKSSLNFGTVKNKIGTFTCPDTVYIHTPFLKGTDITPGKCEILKLCIIANALDIYNSTYDVETLIKLSLSIKKSVIEIDQFDENIRKALNYGHTVGHAIELITGIPHGIAVMYGMYVINKLFGVDIPEVQPTSPLHIDAQRMKTLILKDKKCVNGVVQCIVPVKPGVTEFKYLEISDDLCLRIQSLLSQI